MCPSPLVKPDRELRRLVTLVGERCARLAPSLLGVALAPDRDSFWLTASREPIGAQVALVPEIWVIEGMRDGCHQAAL